MNSNTRRYLISYYSHNTGNGKTFILLLLNEVEEGFDKVETTVTELTSDANSIIASVDDLVSISEIDESKVIEDVQEGKEKANEVVEVLHILDEFETSQLEQTQDDIQTMRTFLTEMESKFASGSLSIAVYDEWGRDVIDGVMDIGKNVKDSIGNAVTGFFGKLTCS